MLEDPMDTMDADHFYDTTQTIDENEVRIRKSVVAYLAWHSGQNFTNDGLDSQMRSSIIDDFGIRAVKNMSEFGLNSNENRIRATKSIRTQASESNSLIMPVCLIDVEAIESKLVLPPTQPEGFSCSLPAQLEQIHLGFENYTEFRDYYNELAVHIIASPFSVLFYLHRFEQIFLQIADHRITERAVFHRIKPEWRFVNTAEHCLRTFEEVSHANDVGRLMRIRGQVVEVGDTMVIATHVAFRCMAKTDYETPCGQINMIEQNAEDGSLVKPTKCDLCNNPDIKKFVMMDSRESKTVPLQRVVIQEEQIGEERRSLMVEIRGALCNRTKSGSTIEVTGIVRLEPISKSDRVCAQYILASSIVETTNLSSVIEISDDDINDIEVFRNSYSLEERMKIICESWVGYIHGIPDVKAAVILQAVGAPTEEQFGHHAAIHLLLMGDPGTVKTQLLKATMKLHPGNQYTDASKATEAGLTGGCIKIDDLYTGKSRWGVVPGIVPLTHPDGICAVDEFNLYKGDMGDFNTVMESGFVAIRKIVKAIITAPASILAAANPRGKDSNRKKFSRGINTPYLTQMGLDFTTASRFHAIYILEDEADMEQDYNIAMSMLQGYTEKTDDSESTTGLSMEFIQKYISMSRQIDPELTKRAQEYVATDHATKRSEAKDTDSLKSHRGVSSLGRFALAAARFDGSEKATMEHIKYAEKIMANTLQERDPGVIDGGLTEESRTHRKDTIDHIVTAMRSIMKEQIAFDEIYNTMKSNWTDIPSQQDVQRIMNDLSRNANLTTLKRHRGNAFSHDFVENPNTEGW